jgi:hypothetical protein
MPAEEDMNMSFLTEAIGNDDKLRDKLCSHIADVVVNDQMDTACVHDSERGVILEFSQKFVDRYLSDAESKKFVLWHEILHVINGDLFKIGSVFGKYPEVVNIAMDIFINRELIGWEFDGRVPQVIRKMYKQSEFPANLLLPPAVLGREIQNKELVKGLERQFIHPIRKKYLPWDPMGRDSFNFEEAKRVFGGIFQRSMAPEPEEFAELYLLGWLGRISFSEFLKRLVDLLVRNGLIRSLQNLVFIIKHDNRSRKKLKIRVRKGREKQGGFSTESSSGSVKAAKTKNSKAQDQVIAAIRTVLVQDNTLRHAGMAEIQFPSVIPSFGRRETYMLQAGMNPVFYTCSTRVMDRTEEGVHLYLDVSGSMDELVPFWLSLIHQLKDQIGPQIWGFSNKVFKTTMKEVAAGQFQTTYGTDLDCVARHALEKRFKKILVVTDGQLGIKETNMTRLSKEAELNMIITHNGHNVYTEMLEWKKRCKRVWEVRV